MPDLIRLAVTVDGDTEDMLSAVLAVHAPAGWEEESLPTGEVRALVHTDNPDYAAELESAIRARLPSAAVSRGRVEDTNWVLAWREFFTPVAAGSRFLVLAPWMEEERRTTERTVIIIEPKMAFGPGHHDTTALCLTAIADLADKKRIGTGMRFLDLGTGSGILGLGCSLLGLTGLGLDTDILAVENARENCAANAIACDGASPVFSIRRGSIADADGEYDIVLANILARPLKEMAPGIVARRGKDGVLVLSGILGIQADSVAAAYMDAGLSEPRRMVSGEWTALVWE
jgi:ribosomal protein L11 methyltransferase